MLWGIAMESSNRRDSKWCEWEFAIDIQRWKVFSDEVTFELKPEWQERHCTKTGWRTF